jgi:hypothetical protein
MINRLIELSLISAFLMIFIGCASWEKMRTKFNDDYFSIYKGIDSTLATNIRNGKVVEGMTPDEAIAAAGPFFYEILPDRNKWGGGIAMSQADIRYYIQ